MNNKANTRIWQNVRFEVCAYIKLLTRPRQGEIESYLMEETQTNSRNRYKDR